MKLPHGVAGAAPADTVGIDRRRLLEVLTRFADEAGVRIRYGAGCCSPMCTPTSS